MKSPQDRSTPFQIDEKTTRMTVNEVGDLVFEQKHYDESRYSDFLRITSVEGCSMFVDVLQYLYASVSEEESMPDRFSNRIPITERSKRFSFSHEDIEVGYTDQNILVEEEAEFSNITFVFNKSEKDHSPMWINLEDIEKIQRMCMKWAENK